jgi:type I restriction-modification system DNA methylase subunit
MIALPSQLFYGAMIPACLWFLTRSRRMENSETDPAKPFLLTAEKWVI